MSKVVAAVRTVLHTIGVDIVRYRPETILPTDFCKNTREIWQAVRPYTMASPERISTLCDAIRYVEANRIPGAIVECGVWRGGSMMAAAKELLNLKSTHRELYLFDTFEGMPPAQDVDVDPAGVSASELFGDKETALKHWIPESVEGVRGNLVGTGYPAEKMRFIKGRVEETIPSEAPRQIALLRLDTDWYESTRHELVHLIPRLVSGGVLIIDDYGYWQGARMAVDEYIEQNGLKILLVRVDSTARMAVVN